MTSCALPNEAQRCWLLHSGPTTNSFPGFNSNYNINTDNDVYNRRWDDDSSKILDFNRLEDDILRNVLDEESEHTNRFENSLVYFPSFNFIPPSLPAGLVKSNPILKLRPGETPATAPGFHQSPTTIRLPAGLAAFPQLQVSNPINTHALQQAPGVAMTSCPNVMPQVAKVAALPRIPEHRVIESLMKIQQQQQQTTQQQQHNLQQQQQQQHQQFLFESTVSKLGYFEAENPKSNPAYPKRREIIGHLKAKFGEATSRVPPRMQKHTDRGSPFVLNPPMVNQQQVQQPVSKEVSKTFAQIVAKPYAMF